MRILDLFCGAGGASMGYHRAFPDAHITGIDLHPQPRYPFHFTQADALDALEDADFIAGFDFVHASPPCQHYSTMSNCRPGLADKYPDLIAATRDRLITNGAPYVIENVPGSPLRDPVELCGHMFGLRFYRHRLFECSFPVPLTMHPPHVTPASKAGHWRPGTIMSVAGHVSPMAEARAAMGIDWMTRDELAESIPPAYTHYIGAQFAAANPPKPAATCGCCWRELTTRQELARQIIEDRRAAMTASAIPRDVGPYAHEYDDWSRF